MLLRFGVENHLSVRGRQELTLAASSLKDHREALIPCDAVDSGAVLPAVVIYGANSSGKTNFVNAISTMQNMVLWSQIGGAPGGGVPRREFQLDRRWSERPSCFDIDFVIDGVRYHYGFEATDAEFTSEWLYEFPKAHRRKMFERNRDEFEFGRSLKGQNNIIKKLTRRNSLFLSAAAQNGHAQLSRFYKYFHDMTFTSSTSIPGTEASEQFAMGGSDVRVIEFLKAINTGVIGFRRNEVGIPTEQQEIRSRLEALITNAVGGKVKVNIEDSEDEEEIVEIELAHLGAGGEVVHLDLSRESAGTRRLMVILSQAFQALDRGLLIIVDELDASLHTYAGEAIVRLFCSPVANRKGAQLIATTHDTNLMMSGELRRDQLWFAEKDVEGATELFSLSDIRTRKGDNYELGYLQGRYGAVPTNDPVAAILETL